MRSPSVPPRPRLDARQIRAMADPRSRARRAHRRGWDQCSSAPLTRPSRQALLRSLRVVPSPELETEPLRQTPQLKSQALRYLESSRVDEAEALLAQAIQAKRTPELTALSAFVRAHRPNLEKQELHELLSDVNEVLSSDGDNAEIRGYRAFILGRMGRDDLMIREYKQVLKLNPKDATAARAIRLHEIRNR